MVLATHASTLPLYQPNFTTIHLPTKAAAQAAATAWCNPPTPAIHPPDNNSNPCSALLWYVTLHHIACPTQKTHRAPG